MNNFSQYNVQKLGVSRNEKRTIFVSLVLFTLMAISVVPYSSVMAKPEPAHVAADLSAINVNDGFAELVKAVRPSVVNISVTGYVEKQNPGQPFNFQDQLPELEEFFHRFFGEIPNLPNLKKPHQNPPPYERKSTAVGSGFIIDPAGLVVTNNHVIEGAEEIEVVFDDGTRIPATLKGADPKSDLALLQIKTDRDLPYVVFGDSDEAEVGDWVVAIGNPFGLGGTTTSGIISARGRDIRQGPLDDFIQIDASINRGNSGGPLFNTKGEVIGINSAIYSPNGGSVGIGFAIPSSMANNVIGQLKSTGTVERGYLGVYIQALTDEIADSIGLEDSNGALVTQVMENSPAEKAGIESGDVILSYDNAPITKMRDLPKFVARTKNGESVEVELWRNDRTKTLNVTIDSNTEPALAATGKIKQSDALLGLGLAKIDQNNVQQYGLKDDSVGVIIVDVDPTSEAAKRGLRAGDLIKRVNKINVSEPSDVIKEITNAKNNAQDSVLLLVESNNQARFVVVPIKA